jgi:hypothetical protein
MLASTADGKNGMSKPMKVSKLRVMCCLCVLLIREVLGKRGVKREVVVNEKKLKSTERISRSTLTSKDP